MNSHIAAVSTEQSNTAGYSKFGSSDSGNSDSETVDAIEALKKEFHKVIPTNYEEAARVEYSEDVTHVIISLLRSSDGTTGGKDKGMCVKQAYNNMGCFDLFKKYNKNINAELYQAFFLSIGASRHNHNECIGLKHLYDTLQNNKNLAGKKIIILVKDSIRVQHHPLNYGRVKQILKDICADTDMLCGGAWGGQCSIFTGIFPVF